MIKNISNLGDAALYCDFGNEVNKSINSQVIKYFKTIKEKKFEGINNLTPSYNKLIISYDLKKTTFKEVKNYVENIDTEQLEILKSLLNHPKNNRTFWCFLSSRANFTSWWTLNN